VNVTINFIKQRHPLFNVGLEKIVKSARKIIYSGLAASMLFLTGCPTPGGPSSGSSTPPPVKNELSENTKVLTSSDISRISYVDNNQITFSDSANYSVGDIIVSDINDKAPGGFLREISSVSGNTVYTQPASIEEAVKNVSFAVQKSLFRTNVRSSSFMKGVSQSVTPKSLVNFNLDINVYDPDTDLTLDGNVSFDSGFVLETDIRDRHMSRLLFKNVISEESALQLTALS